MVCHVKKRHNHHETSRAGDTCRHNRVSPTPIFYRKIATEIWTSLNNMLKCVINACSLCYYLCIHVRLSEKLDVFKWPVQRPIEALRQNLKPWVPKGHFALG